MVNTEIMHNENNIIIYFSKFMISKTIIIFTDVVVHNYNNNYNSIH